MNTALNSIMNRYRASRNPQKAAGMKAYMKDQFEYLGLQKPVRAELRKGFLKEQKATKKIDWNIVRTLWEQPEREFQYLALAYLETMKAFMDKDDIVKIGQLIVTKSWWDSVDGTVGMIGDLVKRFPELKKDVIADWIYDENFWLKRISIIFQLKYKADTDTAFLSKAILSNCGTKEFFINKAIGWALREYSKTNPDWVREFIKNNTLHSLSVREGSKYV
jgi:3-methyladenine DNA glycosylase AlkD